MKRTVPPKTTPVDLIFRAFSDRTRLRILHLIRDGECCVGNIVEILGIEQPSASRHLAYLRRAGLVSVRRAGLWCYYSLAPARLPFHQKLLECLACCFSEVPELRADQARAARVRDAGGCCPGEEKTPAREVEKGRQVRRLPPRGVKEVRSCPSGSSRRCGPGTRPSPAAASPASTPASGPSRKPSATRRRSWRRSRPRPTWASPAATRRRSPACGPARRSWTSAAAAAWTCCWRPPRSAPRAGRSAST